VSAGGRAAWVAAALAALLLLPGLGNHDLWAPDEPRYAQVAREMLHDGDWLLPHVNGRIYTDKPPGWFWLAAALALPAGDVGEAGARLPSALAGIALAVLVAAVASRWWGAPAGIAAAVILTTSWDSFNLARTAHLDTLLTLLTTGALFAARRAIDSGGVTAAAGFWLCMAGATLVKGPVGFLLPLIVIVADRLLARAPRDLLRLRPAWGWLLLVAPPVGWLLTAARLRAGYSPAAVLERHAVGRFASGLHHRNPPWYYAWVFFMEMFPWSLLVPAAIALAWIGLRRAAVARRAGRVPDPATPAILDEERLRFLLVWFFGILLFFTLSREKRGLYILPAFPAAALLVAHLWSRGTAVVAGEWGRLPIRLLRTGVLMGGLVWLALAALPWAAPRMRDFDATALGGATTALAIVGASVGLGILTALLFSRWRLVAGLLAAGACGTWLLWAHGVQPRLNEAKSARPLAETAARLAPPGTRLGMLGFREAYVYYSGRRLEELGDETSARRFLESDGSGLLLIEAEEWKPIATRVPAARILAQDVVGHRNMLIVGSPLSSPER